MSASTDFENYDGFDADEARKFLEGVTDPDELRVYVSHEKGDKDRSTVLTDDIICAALVPSAVESSTQTSVEVPDGVVAGETVGWPVDEEGGVIPLPTSVRDELANADAEIKHLRSQQGEVVGESDADILNKERIRALLDERRTYEARDDAEKVAAVDAELKAIGHKGKPPAKRASTRTKS